MRRESMRTGITGLLVMLMLGYFSHSLLLSFVPHDEELKCYCCLGGESGPTIKCACGCNKHHETDTTGLLSETVPSKCNFVAFLFACFVPAGFPFSPESVWIEVPTHPPKIA